MPVFTFYKTNKRLGSAESENPRAAAEDYFKLSGKVNVEIDPIDEGEWRVVTAAGIYLMKRES